MISRNISQILKSCWWLGIINDHVYYLSGTPATQSQLAKDVTTFLTWAGEPYYDSKKALEFKVKSEIDLKLLISSDFFFIGLQMLWTLILFLHWSVHMWIYFQAYILLGMLFAGSYYFYRRTWSSLKHKLVVPNYSKPKKDVLRAKRPGKPKGAPRS